MHINFGLEVMDALEKAQDDLYSYLLDELDVEVEVGEKNDSYYTIKYDDAVCFIEQGTNKIIFTYDPYCPVKDLVKDAIKATEEQLPCIQEVVEILNNWGYYPTYILLNTKIKLTFPLLGDVTVKNDGSTLKV